MGEKKLVQTLTGLDIFTVILYRSGIVLSTLAFVYSCFFIFFNINNRELEGLFAGNSPQIVFWIFIASVNLSISFLHLYSKKILKIIRIITFTGTLTLLILAFTGNLDFGALANSEGWQGKASILGLGLVLAGFSGIGAKEAFCFKLKEGYAYAVLLAFTVLCHLLGILKDTFGFVLILLSTLLIVSFTVRKLFLPLHYDIGDKSKY